MKKWSLTSVTLILVLLSVIWVISVKLDSYSEPQEAVFANENDLTLIPGYKNNNKALFFYIKGENHLGATYVQNGLFGWRPKMFTWSPMDKKRDYENLSGYQIHGGNLIYGLIRRGDERLVQVGENDAKMLNLAMLPPNKVEKLQLEDLYLWYFESETPLNGEEIKLFNNTGEEINSISL